MEAIEINKEPRRFVHANILCDSCGDGPIVGIRYVHNTSEAFDASDLQEDFCESCYGNMTEEDQSKLTVIGEPEPVPRPVYPAALPDHKSRQLLVIDSGTDHDWNDIFEGAVLPCGSPIEARY